jgi:hypothetical protein
MTMSQNIKEEDMSQFDWITLHNEMAAVDETRKEKLIRKVSENPLIPIGEPVWLWWRVTVWSCFQDVWPQQGLSAMGCGASGRATGGCLST